MASSLSPQPAKEQLVACLMLNKRLIRIVIFSLAFVLICGALVWHEGSHFDDLIPIPYLHHDEPPPKHHEDEHPKWQHEEPPVPAAPPAAPPRKRPEFYPFETTSAFRPVQLDITGKTTEELCATFPKHILETIQPVLKMGHGENHEKVNGQFDSVSACFDEGELLIFSDLEETVRGHAVMDILSDLPPSYYDSKNPDFQNYVWQQEMRANGTLDTDVEATKRINGWILDKFKFLPMIERAWRMKPNKDFYVFFETDTYVFWDNMFRFLQTFDPDHPIYMGSPSPGRVDEKADIKTWFANGGPGFVLSRGAIKALLYREAGPDGQYLDPPLAEKWLPVLRGDPCGDSVLGWALWNVSVPLQGYWPMFNPHPAHGVPFSDMHWCQPPLTLHKTSPTDMVTMWRWEFSRREQGRPLLYSDLWHFHRPGESAVIDNWDNADWDSWTAPDDAHIDSFEACSKHCRENDKCMQYNWRGRDEKKCLLMRFFRYGRAKEPEAIQDKNKDGKVVGEHWRDYKAGWLTDRVQEWRDKKECKAVQWVGPSISRVF